jgi:hypothetical protein
MHRLMFWTFNSLTKIKILNIYLEWKTTVEGVGEP